MLTSESGDPKRPLSVILAHVLAAGPVLEFDVLLQVGGIGTGAKRLHRLEQLECSLGVSCSVSGKGLPV